MLNMTTHMQNIKVTLKYPLTDNMLAPWFHYAAKACKNWHALRCAARVKGEHRVRRIAYIIALVNNARAKEECMCLPGAIRDTTHA